MYEETVDSVPILRTILVYNLFYVITHKEWIKGAEILVYSLAWMNFIPRFIIIIFFVKRIYVLRIVL